LLICIFVCINLCNLFIFLTFFLFYFLFDTICVCHIVFLLLWMLHFVCMYYDFCIDHCSSIVWLFVSLYESTCTVVYLVLWVNACLSLSLFLFLCFEIEWQPHNNSHMMTYTNTHNDTYVFQLSNHT